MKGKVMDLQKIEKRIRRSIAKAVRNGAALVYEGWGVEQTDTLRFEPVAEEGRRCMCPLGAVLICSKASFEEFVEEGEAVAQVLRLPQDQADSLVDAFISGYDDLKSPEPGVRLEREFFRMGRRIRRHFKPVPYGSFISGN
jgi:hypothetical protein